MKKRISKKSKLEKNRKIFLLIIIFLFVLGSFMIIVSQNNENENNKIEYKKPIENKMVKNLTKLNNNEIREYYKLNLENNKHAK